MYFDAMETLQHSLNRKLCLGLMELESHMTVYRPGSFYRKLLGRLQNDGHRLVTSILYLNLSWSKNDGRQLRIYTDSDNKTYFQDILPIEGRLVTFFGDKYPYEEITAMRDRTCMTGLFKTRAPVTTES
jgi:SM-20-related protein